MNRRIGRLALGWVAPVAAIGCSQLAQGGPPYAIEEGGDRPLPTFGGLAFVIEELMLTKRAPWPMERTVLTTGVLAHLLIFFRSLELGGPVATPELAISYQPAPRPFFQTR